VASGKAIDKLRAEIVRRHEQFSPRLKQIARFVLENPDEMGFESLTVIAARCQVQPSTVVRFAKALGFDGGSELQRVFRDELLSCSPNQNYAARIRNFEELEQASGLAESAHTLMQEFASENINALSQLLHSIHDSELRAATALIGKAASIYLVGVRRSFPVVAYLSYALRQAGKPRVYLVDGMAGMLVDQGKLVGRGDLLIATSFKPYAPETVAIVDTAAKRGAQILSLTDSQLSPIARHATVVLEVKDAEVRQFRFLTASLCLAQTLVLAYAIDNQSASQKRSES
jgi:DNA-binding MurR/RpiR family transcriptional regulator